MKIVVTKAPISARFTPDTLYHVYGFAVNLEQAFVFDDEVESFNLSELTYEVHNENN